MSWEEAVMDIVKKSLSGEGGHDYEHTLRVYSLCVKLAELEGADVEILKAASLLHDIARPLEKTESISHSVIGAEIARDILKQTGFPETKIEKVCKVIRTHRFSEGEEAQEIEEKILQDSDRLDAMGAIGIARAFMFGGKNGRSLKETLEHFHYKLLRLREKMYTSSAYNISIRRHEFMEKFLERLQKEMEGEE
ncbi:MAG: HD domain-containing protein [Candidatus Jordarchaeaceae archaeon]